MSWRQRILVTVCPILVALIAYKGWSSKKWTHLTGETMGTTYQIHFQQPWLLGTNSIEADIKSLLLTVNEQLSTWDDASWISSFNRSSAGIELSVPSHAWEVLTCSLEVAKASSGALDPTSFPLIQAWGFGPGRIEHSEVPSPTTVQALKQLCSYQNITLHASDRKIPKTFDGVQIDCSALAKGYAIDQIAAILEDKNLSHFSIEIGGEVRTCGKDPNEERWQVGLEVPNGFSGQVPVLELANQSVATSGRSQVYKMIGDRVYTHIIDPQTGYPITADHPYFSTSVTAPNCMLADALATACYILGPEKSKVLLERFPGCSILYLPKAKSEIPWLNCDP